MKNTLGDVSRETIERLRIFESTVLKWTPKINLVSRLDREVIWDRHILDSVQFYEAAPDRFSLWLDFGSGGGFPGVVAAILAHELNPGGAVTMVESDARKCVFLRTALREAGVNGNVINDRIENLVPQNADIVSARALADLTALLGLAHKHLTRGATCIFAKGEKWRKEVADAKSKWDFEYTADISKLDPNAAILSIKELSRA